MDPDLSSGHAKTDPKTYPDLWSGHAKTDPKMDPVLSSGHAKRIRKWIRIRIRGHENAKWLCKSAIPLGLVRIEMEQNGNPAAARCDDLREHQLSQRAACPVARLGRNTVRPDAVA